MERMLTFTIFMLTIFATLAIPATENNKVDKLSQNEVLGKLPTEDPATDIEKKTTSQPKVRVSIGTPKEDDTKTQRPLFPPFPSPSARNPNMFSRFIDDVFQIPITVLQSVSKLLTNPFNQRNKDKGEASA